MTAPLDIDRYARIVVLTGAVLVHSFPA